MTETPITDRTIKEHHFWDSNPIESDGEPVKKQMKKLELAANKLYSRLSIWVNTAATAKYLDPRDVEALAEFELLKKHD